MRSLAILGNCRRALPRGGCLLVVERVLPRSIEATPDHLSVALSDLNMLRGPGGRERTAEEYHHLLRGSGFEPSGERPAGRWSVLEATAA